MITNTRRGTFTVAAVVAGVLLVGGAAGATALGVTGQGTPDATTTTAEGTTTVVAPVPMAADGSTTSSTVTDGTDAGAAPTTLAVETTTTVVDEAEGPGPDPSGPAAFGLCRAFSGRAGQPGNSRAWARLNEAAGGDIAGWCAAVLADRELQRGHRDAADDDDAAEAPDDADSDDIDSDDDAAATGPSTAPAARGGQGGGHGASAGKHAGPAAPAAGGHPAQGKGTGTGGNKG